MGTLKTFLVLFLSFLVPTGALMCQSSMCPLNIRSTSYSSNPTIQFPFRLSDSQPDRCGYPGFDLSCNNKNQTILSTSTSGDLSVTSIDYWSQNLEVNDPDNCMPGRYLVNFSVDPPFKLDFRTEYRSFTFLNCTTNETYPSYFMGFPCLSGPNYTVGSVLSDEYNSSFLVDCRLIKTASVPLRHGWDGSGSSFFEDVSLPWEEPNCESCQRLGGSCGFKSSSGLEIDCSDIPEADRKGLSEAAIIGLIIGAVAGFLRFVCCFSDKATNGGTSEQPNLVPIARPVPAVATTGLLMSVIESYPKHVIGESESDILTKSDANNLACPICLCEYKSKEEVRMIPECKHYFHVNCIDEWLLKNATCPLCRQSAAGSSPSRVPPLSISEGIEFSRRPDIGYRRVL